MNGRHDWTTTLLIAIALSHAATRSDAQDRNWLSTGNSAWSNPINWVPTGAPLSTDRIVIGELQTEPTVDLDRDDTIAELSLLNKAQFDTNGFRLIVNGPTTFVGDAGFSDSLIIRRGDDPTDLTTQSLSALAGSRIAFEGGVLDVTNGPLFIDQTSLLDTGPAFGVGGNATVILSQSTSDVVFDNQGTVTSGAGTVNINVTGGGQVRLAGAAGTMEAFDDITITGQATAGNHLLEGRLMITSAETVTMDETLLVDGGEIGMVGLFGPGMHATFVGPRIDVTEGRILGEMGGGNVRARVRMMGNSVIGTFPIQTLEFFEPVEFTGTGNVIDNSGPIRFSGGVDVADDSILTFDVSTSLTINDFTGSGTTTSILGDTRFTGDGNLFWAERVVVNGDVVVDNEHFLWSVNAAVETSINPNESLTINASQLSAAGVNSNSYLGTVTLGNNAELSVHIDGTWDLLGTMDMRGGTVLGVNFSVGSETRAGVIAASEGVNRIDPTITLNEMGSLAVEEDATLFLQGQANLEAGSSIRVDGLLRFEAFTPYRGGTITGAGTVDQEGTARFIENTTIDLDPQTGVYNMDGIGTQDTLVYVNPNVSATITANRLNNVGNTFSGSMTIDSGSITINTEEPWTIRGPLTMREQPFGSIPTLDGSTVVIEGALEANGSTNRIDAAVTFMDTADVSVPSGELRLNGHRTEFRGGSYTGAGTIVPSGETVVVQPTTIETAMFELDGRADATVFTVLQEGALTLDVRAIDPIGPDGVPQFDSHLTLFGGDLTINQSDADSWATSFISEFNMAGFDNTPDLNGQPVTLQGIVGISFGLARINVPATLQADPNYTPGFGVPTVTVSVLADSELQFNDTATIDGADISGDGTITFNKSASIGGFTNASIGGVRIGEEGDVAMSSGSIFTDNFEKHAQATLDLNGGAFQVIRGTGQFNSGFAIGGGTDELTQPNFAVLQGADVSITRSWTIGENEGEFGRTQVSSISLDNTRQSTLRSTAPEPSATNLVVGENGTGDLFIEGGGLVELPGVTVIGRNDTAFGRVTVAGTRAGHRSTLDVRQDAPAHIHVGGVAPQPFSISGGGGSGELTVADGGLVLGSANMYIAGPPGSSGVVSVGGEGGGFHSEVMVDGDVFISGNLGLSGGPGTLNLDDGGSFTADTLYVRGPIGAVNMNGGEMHLNTLDLTLGTGNPFHFNGGELYVLVVAGNFINPGGDINPGGSPGVLDVSGDYTQGEDATLTIELGGTVAGDQYDQLRVGGVATLAGTLAVEFYDDGSGLFFPSDGDSFEIVTAAGGIDGQFDELELPDVGENVTQQVTYLDNSVFIDYRVLALLAGDYNGNGLVEQGDLDLVLLNWGADASRVDGNWASGAIDQDELDGVLLNWGNQVADQAASSIPEPSGIILGLLVATVVLMTSRRSARRTHHFETDESAP